MESPVEGLVLINLLMCKDKARNLSQYRNKRKQFPATFQGSDNHLTAGFHDNVLFATCLPHV